MRARGTFRIISWNRDCKTYASGFTRPHYMLRCRRYQDGQRMPDATPTFWNIGCEGVRLTADEIHMRSIASAKHSWNRRSIKTVLHSGRHREVKNLRGAGLLFTCLCYLTSSLLWTAECLGAGEIEGRCGRNGIIYRSEIGFHFRFVSFSKKIWFKEPSSVSKNKILIYTFRVNQNSIANWQKLAKRQNVCWFKSWFSEFKHWTPINIGMTNKNQKSTSWLMCLLRLRSLTTSAGILRNTPSHFTEFLPL